MAVLEKLHRRHKDIGFLVIAIWKLLRAVLCVLVALWALAGLQLVSPEKSDAHTFWSWFRWMQVGGSHRFVQNFLVRHGFVQEGSMMMICIGFAAYSVKLFIEGFGLWFEKAWAPYLVIFFTTAFIPYELYQLVQNPTTFSWQFALVINLIVVGYLAFRLVQTKTGDTARQLRVLSRMKLFYASVASLAVVSFLDYISGSEFFFFIFYIIPVVLYAWYSNLTETVITSVVCGFVWWFTDWVGGHHYAHPWFGYWNAFACFLSFSAVGFALNVVRRHEESLRKATQQYLEALEEIRTLKARLNALTPQAPPDKSEGRERVGHPTTL